MRVHIDTDFGGDPDDACALALQSEANAVDSSMAALGRDFSGLPDDLVNFHWDPVTCAIAVGWPEAQVEELQLVTEMDGDILAFGESPHGRATRVVFDIDVAAFTETFLSRVETVRPVSGNGPRLVPTRQAE